MKKGTKIFIGVLIFAAIGAVIYFFVIKKKDNEDKAEVDEIKVKRTRADIERDVNADLSNEDRNTIGQGIVEVAGGGIGEVLPPSATGGGGGATITNNSGTSSPVLVEEVGFDRGHVLTNTPMSVSGKKRAYSAKPSSVSNLRKAK